MASSSFEFEPVDALAVASVGEPGRRVFYLVASGQGRSATLRCEKFHVQGLVTRMQQALEAQGAESGLVKEVPPSSTPADPVEADWEVSELGLGFHESRGLFVIVAKELTEAEDAAVARLWASVDQVRGFIKQAEIVLAGGRPTCGYCGLPIDPGGHPCPVSNGSRPIL